MGDVLEFPSQRAQGLAFLDREVRQLLEAKGADAALVEFAAEQLTEIYAQLSEAEQYHFSLHLPAGLADDDRAALEQQLHRGLEGIRRDNHALLVNLVAQLVVEKMRVYELSRRAGVD